MKKHILLFGAITCMGIAHTAGAAAMVTYTYVAQPQGGALALNSKDIINIYLQETYPSTGSSYATGDGGLYSGGVAFVEQAGGSGVSMISPTPNGAAEPNGFTGNNSSGLASPAGGAWIEDITGNSASVGVTAVSTTTANSVTTKLYLLGTVALTVSAAPNATFDVESIHDAPAGQGIANAGLNNSTLTFTSGSDLDVGGTSNGNVKGANGNATPFSVTPEPTSMAMGATAICGLLARRRRTTIQ